MAKKKSEILEIVYKVTGDFGQNEEGDLRRAFIIAGDVQSFGEHVLIFHPKDVGGSGCIEFGIPSKDDGYYTTLSLKKPLYTNLSTKEEKRYRAMVESILGPIPKDLSLDRVTLEQEKLQKSLPKRKLNSVKKRL